MFELVPRCEGVRVGESQVDVQPRHPFGITGYLRAIVIGQAHAQGRKLLHLAAEAHQRPSAVHPSIMHRITKRGSTSTTVSTARVLNVPGGDPVVGG